MINIEELTIKDARAIAAMFGCSLSPSTPTAAAHPYEIGKAYCLRTVTMTDTGIVKAVYPNELVLTDAAWIADTGRFSDAVAKAEFGEVEPFPAGEIIIGRGAIVDGCIIHTAPKVRK